jgi:8-oxo-dGTP pyrophosphatase MutT (NUDIX family)
MCWEFLGGKLEDGETVREAAVRELNEETDLEVSRENFLKYDEGETYRSSDDEKYRLNPVLIEVEEETAGNMSQKGLSDEHSDFSWIEIEDFFDYETLGQYRALENLEIIEGDVALAVARKSREGKFLVLKRSEATSSSGYWNFPGGKIERDESRKQATLRELGEETGLEGEILEAGDPYINGGELGHWRIFPFLVEASGKVELNGEHSDFSWIDLGELENLETLGTSQAVENLGIHDG